ncbi:phage holin family protein [Agromyces mangrovi Wang et al. 2018]|uniref:phage holin family protein n=1 Tax=Agromyces mangrovi TaxID=1858653 RepID=UPI002572FAC7|nr:phage holin family protein [Agromyces mangrovi]BDZ64784.1 membrane protein [Agromyces mangrovi]
MAAPTDKDRSLFTLVGDVPAQVQALVQAEIAHIKAELAYKAKHFGIGAGLMVAAAFVAIFLLGTLIATGILALSLVLPGWAAALIVSGILLLIIAVLVGIGIVMFQRGAEPPGDDASDSVKKDFDAIKGVGDYER